MIPNSTAPTSLDQLLIDELSIFVKREDLNITGSQKDRGIKTQISEHAKAGSTQFVLSSSGNSAISAVNAIHGTDLKLYIFLSNSVSSRKLDRLSQQIGESVTLQPSISIRHRNVTISFSSKAISESAKFAEENGWTHLRGSKDPLAKIGYEEIAGELRSQAPLATDIFIPTSSGTTLAGVYDGYIKAKKTDSETTVPRFHICQTTAVNIFAREFDKQFTPGKSTLADSIVDRVGHRYIEIIEIVRESGGGGWVLSDLEIEHGSKGLSEHGLNLSDESGLALAAWQKAVKHGFPGMNQPIILATGVK